MKALTQSGLVDRADAAGLEAVAQRYAVSITPAMAARIGPEADDPVRRQFVPTELELRTYEEELDDPVGDGRFTPVPGITHRYRDRVLLKPSHICPVYCRFCFRRETVGPVAGLLSDAELDTAMAYVRTHPEVWEVILTGGDPLHLSAERIARIVRQLDEIEHVRVIRIHTRVPVVSPERVTPVLVDALTAESAVWVAVHCNHRRELGPDAVMALRALTSAGIPLLGQTVLLKGVNDDAAALEDLFRALVELKVKPYYLHHGDLAPGTAHFRTTIEAGQELARRLRGPVSGLCQPTYILDIPGGYGKVPIGGTYLRGDAGSYVVTDPAGTEHSYADVVAPHQEGTA